MSIDDEIFVEILRSDVKRLESEFWKNFIDSDFFSDMLKAQMKRYKENKSVLTDWRKIVVEK